MAPLPVKCKHTDPYVERPLIDEFTWLVYNTRTGHIVAATYSSDMAAVILRGIRNEKYVVDTYAITEVWKPPEPKV